jgi:uncharacterized UBP type Zn finger protein
LTSVAKISVPLREDNSFEVEKEASEKAEKATNSSWMGAIIRHTGCFLSSIKTLLAFNRCFTFALVTMD